MQSTPIAIVLAALCTLSPLSLRAADLPDKAKAAVTLRGDYANSLHRFAEDKKGNVAFLGGSITENGKGHSSMVPQWLKKRFPETEFTFTNAGISSTCSTTGAFRLREHILSKGPVDLLIVEFAVNDDQDAMHARQEALRGMEGIIRHTRVHNPKVDILMVHYVNPPILEKLQAGEVPVSIDAHESVAERYDVATVNVGKALASGAMDWPTYGGTHPKTAGYRLASDLMIHALEEAWRNSTEVPVEHALPDPLDPHSYGNGLMVSGLEAAWMGGWTHGPVNRDLLPQGQIRGTYESWDLTVASEPDAMLTFRFSGTAVGAFVLAGPDAGIVEASMDGGPFKAVDLYHRFSEKLNYPRTVMFYSGLETGKHSLVLRLAKRPADQPGGNRAAILKFVVNE